MKNSEQPAFPTETEETQTEIIIYHGLTKREYFAAMAMQGLMTAQNEDGTWTHDIKNCAEISIKMADELLKQLEK